MKKLTLAAVALLAIAGMALAENFAITLNGLASNGGADLSLTGSGASAISDSLTLGGNAAVQNSAKGRIAINNWQWTGTDTLSFDVTIADGYELTALSIQGSVVGNNGYAPANAAWFIGGESLPFTISNTANTDINGTISGLSLTGTQTVSLQTLGTTSASGTNRGGSGSWVTSGSVNIYTTTFTGTVQAVTDVPEPATLSLLGLGALAMVFRRKLRK